MLVWFRIFLNHDSKSFFSENFMKTHFAKIILGIFVSISLTLSATDGTMTIENVEVLEAPTEEQLDSMEGILAAWVSRIQTTEGQNTLHTSITRVLREQGTIENGPPCLGNY